MTCRSLRLSDKINYMERQKPSLEEIFSPRGVAVVGASPRMSFATRVVQSLKEAGFPTIYPVNYGYNEVLGLPCYSSLQAIPRVVDHVVVGIPAESVLTLLDDCAAKGVKSVHLFTARCGETHRPSRLLGGVYDE